MICGNCQHTFTPRSVSYKCPKCKNKLTLEQRLEILRQLPPEQKCYRCGHTWQPRSHGFNKCPKCRSKRYNEKRGPPRFIDYIVQIHTIKSRKTGETLYTFDAVSCKLESKKY